MKIFIEKIINYPVSSNCYIIGITGESSCIIIDPGSETQNNLLEYLNRNNLHPEFIFLTHEHFDHIWGVDILRKSYSSKLFCGDLCGFNISDSKCNLSLFYDQKGFQINPPDFIYENLQNKFFWKGLQFNFYNTPGHTSSSFTISLLNYLFVGDLISLESYTVTKLPTGDKGLLQISIDFLFNEFNGECIVYPGHGNNFKLNTVNRNMFIKNYE